MIDEKSAGVTEHPFAALLLLAVSAYGAYLLHALPVSAAQEHVFFHHDAFVTATALLGVLAGLAFPVWVARPLLAAALPAWGRGVVWTLFAASAAVTYLPEAQFYVADAHDQYLVHLGHARARRAMTVPPRVQSLRALERGDSAFMGIMGYATIVPGVENLCTYESRGVRVVEGTGDVVYGSDDRDFQSEAFEYARTYNRVIIDRLHIPAGELAPLPRSWDGPCPPDAAHHGETRFPLPADMP